MLREEETENEGKINSRFSKAAGGSYQDWERTLS